jgi:hypothetical protein
MKFPDTSSHTARLGWVLYKDMNGDWTTVPHIELPLPILSNRTKALSNETKTQKSFDGSSERTCSTVNPVPVWYIPGRATAAAEEMGITLLLL